MPCKPVVTASTRREEQNRPLLTSSLVVRILGKLGENDAEDGRLGRDPCLHPHQSPIQSDQTPESERDRESVRRSEHVFKCVCVFVQLF